MPPRPQSLDQKLAAAWNWQGLEGPRHHSRDASPHGRARTKEQPRAIDDGLIDDLTALELEELSANGAFDRPGDRARGNSRGGRDSDSEYVDDSVRVSLPQGSRDRSYERPQTLHAPVYDGAHGAHGVKMYSRSRYSGFNCLLEGCTRNFQYLDNLKAHQEKRHANALKKLARRSAPVENYHGPGQAAERRLHEGRDTAFLGQRVDDVSDDGFDSDSRRDLSKSTTSYDKKKGKQPQSRIPRSSRSKLGWERPSTSSTKSSSSHSKPVYRERSGGFFGSSSWHGSSSKKEVVKSRPKPLVYTRPGWPRRSSGGPYMSGALQVKDDEVSDCERAGPLNRVENYHSGSDEQWDHVDGPSSYGESGPSKYPDSLTKDAQRYQSQYQAESSYHSEAELRETTTDDEEYQAAIHASLQGSRNERGSIPPNPAVDKLDDTSDFYLLSSRRKWTQVAGILGHADDTPNMISLSKLTQLGYDARQIDTYKILSYVIDFNKEAKTLGCIPLWYTTLRGPSDRKPKKLLFQVFDAENFPWDVVLRDTRCDGAATTTEKSTIPMDFGDWKRLGRDEREELDGRNRRKQRELKRLEEARST